MIDEDVLAELLQEAAAAAPPPGRAPETLFSSLEESPTHTRRTMRRPAMALAAVALVGVLLVGVLFVTRDDSTPRVSLANLSPSTTIAGHAAGGAGGASSVGTVGGTASSGGSTASGATGGGATPAPPAEAPAVPATPGLPADAPRVVKTGTLDIEIAKGAFQRAVDRITSLTTGLGGYVAESSTTEADDVPNGSIKVRVPASSFEQLVSEVRRLGEVKSISAKGVDVTAEFTDLDARLNALNTTRDRLYEVLRGARNVGDIIAVQDRITGVQTEIEQIQGRERLLTDQTSFGTLAITVAEPGAPEVKASKQGGDGGLGGAWHEARRRFGDAIEGLIEWSGTAVVFVLLALAGVVLIRLAWPRLRRRAL